MIGPALFVMSSKFTDSVPVDNSTFPESSLSSSFTDIPPTDNFETNPDHVEDKELEEIREKMKQMEEEALQWKEMQSEVEKKK